jgi:hypothetical protein
MYAGIQLISAIYRKRTRKDSRKVLAERIPSPLMRRDTDGTRWRL